MIKKILILSIGLLIGTAGTIAWARYQNNNHVVPFHEHADFALFLNGERFDFSKSEFMSYEPCIAYKPPSWIPSANAHAEGEGGAEVHLHDNNGEVIHVHEEGVRYHDFFASLNMEFQDDRFVDHEGSEYVNNDENSFRFFINGKEVETLAEAEIRDLDETLITYGPRDRSEESIQLELAQVTNDACFYSEACPHRGPAYIENCGGAVSQPFLLKWMGI